MTWIFELNNGQVGEKHITNDLIINESIARQRATAEFLDGGYRKRYVTFETYRTDLSVGDAISIRGLDYKVTAMSVRQGDPSIVTVVEAVRYE